MLDGETIVKNGQHGRNSNYLDLHNVIKIVALKGEKEVLEAVSFLLGVGSRCLVGNLEMELDTFTHEVLIPCVCLGFQGYGT